MNNVIDQIALETAIDIAVSLSKKKRWSQHKADIQILVAEAIRQALLAKKEGRI